MNEELLRALFQPQWDCATPLPCDFMPGKADDEIVDALVASMRKLVGQKGALSIDEIDRFVARRGGYRYVTHKREQAAKHGGDRVAWYFTTERSARPVWMKDVAALAGTLEMAGVVDARFPDIPVLKINF